jgi:hypothetical protein
LKISKQQTLPLALSRIAGGDFGEFPTGLPAALIRLEESLGVAMVGPG